MKVLNDFVIENFTSSYFYQHVCDKLNLKISKSADLSFTPFLTSRCSKTFIISECLHEIIYVKSKFLKILGPTIILLIMSITLNAQNSNQEPNETLSEIEKELTKQKNITTLKKEISNNQKSIIENQRNLAKPFDLKPTDGNTKIEGEFIEGLLIVDKNLSTGMAKMTKAISNNFKKEIVLIYYDKTTIDKIAPYKTLLAEIDVVIDQQLNVKENAEKLLNIPFNSKAPSESAPLVTSLVATYGVIQSVGAILSTFKTDLEFDNYSVDVPVLNIVSALKAGCNDSTKIYAPGIFPVIPTSNEVKDGDLMKKVSLLIDNSGESKAVYESTIKRIGKLKNELKSLNDDEKKYAEEFIALHENAAQNLKAYLDLVESLNSRMFESKDGSNLFSNLLAIERISELMEKANTYTIKIEVAAKGGHFTRKGWFIRNRIEHNGGVMIRCLIFNNHGLVVFSDVQRAYSNHGRKFEME